MRECAHDNPRNPKVPCNFCDSEVKKPGNPHVYWVWVISLITPCELKKKASFCNEALKGSLNLKVSKGPEETTGRDFLRSFSMS
jgi:hypothetical protein